MVGRDEQESSRRSVLEGKKAEAREEDLVARSVRMDEDQTEGLVRSLQV